jgi:hypothetical protein
VDLINASPDSFRFSLLRRLYVTLMRHLCCFSDFVPLVARFVIQPSGFGFLIPLPGGTLFFCSCQRCTRAAVSIAPIATTANAHGLMTTLAFENPAVWESHL